MLFFRKKKNNKKYRYYKLIIATNILRCELKLIKQMHHIDNTGEQMFECLRPK